MSLGRLEAYTTPLHSFDPGSAFGPEIRGLLNRQDLKSMEGSGALDYDEGLVVGEFDPALQKKINDLNKDVQEGITRVWGNCSMLMISGCLSSASVTFMEKLINTNVTITELRFQYNFLRREDYERIIASVYSNKIIQSLFIGTLGPIIGLPDFVKAALLNNKKLAHHNRCKRVMTLQLLCFKAMTGEKIAYSMVRTGFENLGVDELGSLERIRERAPKMYCKQILDFVKCDQFDEEQIITYFD